MLKKTITYEDYNGNSVTESFYFHLSKPELIELEVDYDKGLAAEINKIVETDNNKELIAIFKRIIALSYGVKSEDGKRFSKSDDIRNSFMETAAYSELFMELATDADAAAEFITGLLPADMAAEAEKAQAESVVSAPALEASEEKNETPNT